MAEVTFDTSKTNINSANIAEKKVAVKTTKEEDIEKIQTDSYDSSSYTSTKQVTEENDGKFSLKVALKNLFIDGALNTIKQIVSHPAETMLILGAVMLLASYCPILIPAMTYFGIGYGGFEILNGSRKAIKSYINKDYDELEKSFKDIGSGTFNLATSGILKNPMQRLLKFAGKPTKYFSHETVNWFSKVYTPKLKRLEKGAVAFGIFGFAEGLHIGHSMIHLDATSTLLGLGLFVLVKYLYMGHHYRKEIKQGAKALKEGLAYLKKDPQLKQTIFQRIKEGSKVGVKELLVQLKGYIILGERTNTIGILTEVKRTEDAAKVLSASIQAHYHPLVSTTTQRKKAKDLINLLIDWYNATSEAQRAKVGQKLIPYWERMTSNLKILDKDGEIAALIGKIPNTSNTSIADKIASCSPIALL